MEIKVEKLSFSPVKYILNEKNNSRFENKFICMFKLFTDERLGVGLCNGKELKGMTGNSINRYCDSTIMPITEEGKVRYIISIIVI